MTGRLAGKRALIAGAATGMGLATARRFAAEDARLVLFGLGGALLEDAARGIDAEIVHGDVTKPADIAQATSGAPFDIVVNAAGIHSADDPDTIDDTNWSRVIAVNATGTMMVCRAVLPGMRAARRGSIVNIASVAAFNATPGGASYAASKAAIVALTRSIANTYGPGGIRANVVAPGWVRTPMSEKEMDEAAASNGTTREQEFANLRTRIALRRVAEPDEIAACCLFLASDEASFVTGAILVADGGGRASAAARAI